MSVRVLLVDDHAVMRDGLRVLLEAGAEVQVVGEAKDGQEAISQTESLCPDVVIMDIHMPGMNGIEATQRILKACPATKVVILSMYGAPEHIYRAREAGVKGYILKESAGKEVLEAVLTVHSGARHLDPKVAEKVIDGYVRKRREASRESRLRTLSPREREVMQLLVEGKSCKDIGNALGLSAKSIETYRRRLMLKLGIKDVPNLVKYAIERGIVTLDGAPSDGKPLSSNV